MGKTYDLLDPQSMEEAIAFLEQYQKWAEEKARELCRRLAEIGANVARINFAGGFVDDNDDVEVTVEPTSTGYQILASGESVCFLEFGTGIAAGNGYDTSVIDPPVSIEQGSWSKTQGTGEFARWGSWHHNGRKYEMTVPRMGMYHAMKEIERVLPSIAKEVFKS